MRILPLCLTAFLALALTACQSVDLDYHKGIKKTKKFYYTYVNTPAKLDIENKTILEDSERHLVQSVMRIDEEMTKLLKAMDALAAQPGSEEAAALLQRFPWISGLTVLEPDGTVGASVPSVPLKNLDYAPLLETEEGSLPRSLRVSVQDTDMGPEFLIARPFLQADQIQSFLVATFDFRSLLPFTTSADDLTVRTPDVLIWCGSGDYAATPMASIDWKAMLKEETDGVIEDKGRTILWMTRYFVNVPIIFGATTK